MTASKKKQWCFLCALLAGLMMLASGAQAHEARPAYLEINQISPQRYSLLWRTPLLSGQRLPIALKLPDDARNVTEPACENPQLAHQTPDGRSQRRADRQAHRIRRATSHNNRHSRACAVAERHVLDHAGSAVPALDRDICVSRMFSVAAAFVLHGIEHILFGFDHLLFVLALILIVRSGRVLLVTITAFTIAHSVTLTLATLGVVHVPDPRSKPRSHLAFSTGVRNRPFATRPDQPDGAMALGGSLFIRVSSRVRVCWRAHGHWDAAGRHPTGAPCLQRRR